MTEHRTTSRQVTTARHLPSTTQDVPRQQPYTVDPREITTVESVYFPKTYHGKSSSLNIATEHNTLVVSTPAS